MGFSGVVRELKKKKKKRHNYDFSLFLLLKLRNEILNCSGNRMRRKREAPKEEETRKREKKILVNREGNKLWKKI